MDINDHIGDNYSKENTSNNSNRIHNNHNKNQHNSNLKNEHKILDNRGFRVGNTPNESISESSLTKSRNGFKAKNAIFPAKNSRSKAYETREILCEKDMEKDTEIQSCSESQGKSARNSMRKASVSKMNLGCCDKLICLNLCEGRYKKKKEMRVFYQYKEYIIKMMEVTNYMKFFYYQNKIIENKMRKIV